MPRLYKRKTTRASISQDVLQRAAGEVAGGTSVRSAAKDFRIDRMTLTRYIANSEQGVPHLGYSAVSAARQVFTPQMERDLATHVKNLADQFHGLSPTKCRELAFEFAQSNNVDVPTNWNRDRMAGKF